MWVGGSDGGARRAGEPQLDVEVPAAREDPVLARAEETQRPGPEGTITSQTSGLLPGRPKAALVEPDVAEVQRVKQAKAIHVQPQV